MAESSWWRQLFDAFEQPLRAHAEATASTAEFSSMLMQAVEQWQSLTEKSKETTAKLMHMSNVPAYSDVSRLSRQVGTLIGRVDTLAHRVETLIEMVEQLAPPSRPPAALAKPQGAPELRLATAEPVKESTTHAGS